MYTATRTYYDHANRPLEVHAPNAPVQQYTYDAKGRQILSASVAANQTITATETAYDANDRALQSIRSERYAEGAFIHSYTYSWYDDAGRVIATANYGTGNTTYSVGGSAPGYGPEPPESSAEVLVTWYEYDAAGRQTAVAHPDGRVTRSQYDGLGRVRLVIENAAAAPESFEPVRYTAYYYEQARLVMIAAVDPTFFTGGPANADWSDLNSAWFGGEPRVQITTLKYDAEVYRGHQFSISKNTEHCGWEIATPSGIPWTAESANGGWVAHVTYPNGDWLQFTYYSDGSVATRSDSKGNTLYYAYDDRGRLTDVRVDECAYYPDWNCSYPPQHPKAWIPSDRDEWLQFTYDDDGRMATVTANSYNCENPGHPRVVAQSVFDYDDLGNLLAERQQHWDEVEPGTPAVQYEWQFADHDSGNYNRLTGSTYPVLGVGAPTSVGFDFNGDASVDSALSRVTALTGTVGALYGYIGQSRRVSTTLGNGVVQSFGWDGSYPGLDQYGRVQDLSFAGADHQYVYGYDLAGNRLYAHVTHATLNGTPHVEDRNATYAYDALQRLTYARIGASGNPKQKLTWGLDDLSNWVFNPISGRSGLLREVDADGDGIWETTLSVNHAVDPANEITTVTTDVSGDPNGPVEQLVVSDRAGNLTWDGQLFYQFDGFNRLVQVNLADELDPNDFELEIPDPNQPPGVVVMIRGTGKLLDATDLGPVLAHFVHDGLGRLIETTRYDRQGNSQFAEYYYDGVRRIGEVETTYLYDPNDPNHPTKTTARREYVWGPDYVDEIVALIEDAGEGPITYYCLQDANYNVVAVMSMGGVGVPPAVMRQYTYEPYGAVVFADENGAEGLPPLPNNRLGHQGLFFERLYVDPSESLLDPALSPGAVGLYYMRNRWLSPQLGRFLQRDTNETALLVQAAMATNGQALDAAVSGFDAQSHYGDGMNLYQYVGSNPVDQVDPAGLDWYDGKYDDIDQMINELIGGQVNVLGTLAEGIRWIDVGIEKMTGIAMSLMGIDSMKAIVTGQGGFWDYLDVAMTVCPAGKLGKAGKILAEANKLKVLARAGEYVGRLVGHHTVPTAVLKELRPEVARAGRVHGMRGCKNIWKIPEDLHKDLHRGANGGIWNDAWWKELQELHPGRPAEAARQATAEEIVAIREKLVQAFGLERYRK